MSVQSLLAYYKPFWSSNSAGLFRSPALTLFQQSVHSSCCGTVQKALASACKNCRAKGFHQLAELSPPTSSNSAAATLITVPITFSSLCQRLYSTTVRANKSIEDAGSSSIIRAADDLQASLYRPEPQCSDPLSLDHIIHLLRQRFSQGKLVDSDILRKLASVWSRRGMGRKGFESILDLLEDLSPQGVSERLLNEHKRQDLLGLWQFSDSEWKLDLHGADVEGGQVLLLAWFSEVRRRVCRDRASVNMRIVTGWGKHSRVQGVSDLSTAVKLVLQLTNSPFKQSIGNAGRFEARTCEVRDWLDQRTKDSKEKGRMSEIPTESK